MIPLGYISTSQLVGWGVWLVLTARDAGGNGSVTSHSRRRNAQNVSLQRSSLILPKHQLNDLRFSVTSTKIITNHYANCNFPNMRHYTAALNLLIYLIYCTHFT